MGILNEIVTFNRLAVTSNSGVSTKSIVMLTGMYLSVLMTVTYLILSVIDYIKTDTLDYKGAAILITAEATFVLAAAWGKTRSEQAYWMSQGSGDITTGDEQP